MKEKLEKDERTVWAIVRGIIALILLMFIIHGFIIKPQGSGSAIDLEFLWDALHPASTLNIIGVILFFVPIVGLSGLWKKMFDSYTVDLVSEWIGWVFLVSGALGVIFMFI
jgi:hypothetical protein